MIKRRYLSLTLVFFLIVSLLIPSKPVQAAREWQRYNQAESLYKQGNIQEAAPILEALVYDMQKIGQNEAAGFCAQYLGKIMDQWGRYEEAVKYYRLEAELWDRLGHQDWTLTDKRRAETINPEIQLFIEKKVGAGSASGKLEPANGAIFGTTILRDPAVNGSLRKAEQVYGRSFSGILGYVLWGDLPSAVSEVEEAKKAGVALQLAWQPDQGLQLVQDNQYTRQFIRELGKLNIPVFLRFGGEMNGDWTQWSGNSELYKEKFRLIASLVQEGAPNVAMVWSPNYVPENEIDTYYPGDQWVDWVGINAYSDYYFRGDPYADTYATIQNYQGHEANPMTKFKAIYQRYSSRKPIMICETGIAWANLQPYQDVSAWGAYNLKRFYGYLPLVYPRIKAVFYFNNDLSEALPGVERSHYRISQNSRMLEAFQEATISPWYLDDPQTSSPLTYERVSGQLPVAGTLACYIPLGPTRISRVEYWANDSLVGASNCPPWRVTYQEGQKVSGELKVIALDEAGQSVLTASFLSSQPQTPAQMTGPSAIRIMFNGQPLVLDVPPIIVKDRVLVPIRVIAEEVLEAQVDWDEKTHTATLVLEGKTVKLRINDDRAYVNRELVKLDVPAQIVNQRTLVPLRFVSESLGAEVSWDGLTQTVNLTRTR
ncbi:MAG: hypothetical protein GX295_08540 [Syntrophomonadaceae bacterium]|nr:hypothetical protein [Syntrophomonadaceae bacterium]